jgi:regulatory protein
MLITAVTEQKKDPKRVSVYIDGKFAFGMTKVDCLYYHIKEDNEITEDEYNKILTELIYVKAKDKAVKLLGFSARTEKELVDKLSKDYSPEICERVIEMLKKYGYIDDSSYATSYISDSFKFKGWGSRRIKSELRHKGVDDETIDQAITNAELDEQTKAYELLKKRLKGNTCPDYKERSKHYRYLVGRGFSYDDINSAFSRLTETEDDWS